jgi:FMN phosphatase YigB (HAD superfamily)
MIKAVLIDLDNTLVLFDESVFFEDYLVRLHVAFSDVMNRQFFRIRLLDSTRALVENDGRQTNAVHFMDRFAAGFEDRREDFLKRFAEYYSGPFLELKSHFHPVAKSRDVLRFIVESGLKCVIASNPLWPMAVQKQRLIWAGLGDLPFDHITHVDNTSFCKPRLGYFQEIGNAIEVPPEQCLMVGNDPINDMAAGRIGMKTYFTTDASHQGKSELAISREICNRRPSDNTLQEYKPDFEGTLADLPRAVRFLAENRFKT